MINPEFLAKVATDALLQEVNLAPKPGLVDPISVGAHKDMTKETFYQSIVALRPYLLAYAEAGAATMALHSTYSTNFAPLENKPKTR